MMEDTNINPALIKVWSNLTDCNQSCAGINNQPAHGIMPRGFYCPFAIEPVKLLIVSKNPGQGSAQEYNSYKYLDASNRVSIHMNHVKDWFDSGQHRYYRNILDWVSIILDVEPTHDAVFQHAAMTALVKCQSQDEQTDYLLKPTCDTCSDHYLYQEIDIIQPTYLLALGGEVYSYLTKKSVKNKHQLPVGKLYHPSWKNMKGGVENYKTNMLPILKKQYTKSLNTKQ